MSTILEQKQQPLGRISWENLVQQIADGTLGMRIIRTKNRQTGFLRHGVLSGAHFKIPEILIAFEVDELHVAQSLEKGSKSAWENAGDDYIEVEIMENAPPPARMPNGDILFNVGDTDYKICSL